MKYQLITSGRLRKGRALQDALDYLGQHSGFSEEVIRDRILSERSQRLMVTGDLRKARGLHKLLLSAGVEAQLLTESGRPVKRAFGQVFALVAVFLMVAVLLSVFVATYRWLGESVPEEVLGLEQQLLVGEAELFAYVNVEKLVQLRDLGFGVPDPAGFTLPQNRKPLFTELYAGEPDLANRLRHVVMVASRRADGESAAVIALMGYFEPDQVRAALERHTELEELEDGILRVREYRVSETGKRCPQQPGAQDGATGTFFVRTDQDRILLSSSLTRLRAVLSPANSDNSDTAAVRAWHSFRHGKLAALVSMPSQTGEAGSQVVTTADLFRWAGIQSVRASVVPSFMRMATRLDLDILEGPGESGKVAVDGIARELRNYTPESDFYSATLESLLERIDIHTESDRLSLATTLDNQIVDAVPVITKEILIRLSRRSMEDTAGPPEHEVSGIQEMEVDPWDYGLNQILLHLPAYEANQYNKPRFIADGGAIDLHSIAWDRKRDAIKIRLDAEMMVPRLETQQWARSGAQIMLRIDKVQDSRGENLLRDESCESDTLQTPGGKNHQSATRNLYAPDGRARVSKEVRLDENARLADLKSVQGVLALTAPVNVGSVKLKAEKGEVAERSGLRLYVRRVRGGTVWVQLSGAPERFVELRGYNAAGGMLKAAGGVAFEDGERTFHFKGDLAMLELFYSDSTIVHPVPFDLQGLLQGTSTEQPQPMPATAVFDYADWQPLKSLQPAALDVASMQWEKKGEPVLRTESGPLVITLDHDQASRRDTTVQVRVYMPFSDAMLSQNRLIELQLDPFHEEGRGCRGVLRLNVPYQQQPTPRYVPQYRLGKQPYAATTLLSCRTGLKQGEQIDKAIGKVVLRFKQDIQPQEVEFPRLGKPIGIDPLRLQLSAVSYVREEFNFILSGETDKLAGFEAVTTEGRRINGKFEAGDSRVRVTLPLRDDYAKLVLYVAEKTITEEYPFQLGL